MAQLPASHRLPKQRVLVRVGRQALQLQQAFGWLSPLEWPAVHRLMEPELH